MRKRSPRTDELPPERLWRFNARDWLPLVDWPSDNRVYEAYRLYRAARWAWCEENGVTPAELWHRVPRPVVADRPVVER